LYNCCDLCACFIVGCFMVSIAANNYSQVDKLWSITPWVYVWVYCYASKQVDGEVNDRLLMMAYITTLWGSRMTLNFNRRGGYSWPPWGGEEDYRWEHVRRDLEADEYPFRWQLFNLSFICVFQHILLMCLTLPAYVAYQHRDIPLNCTDWTISGVFMLLLFLETKADNEQYEFQTEKYRLKGEGKRLTGEYKAGFLSSGLFWWCRHPAHACEQLIWICFFLFSWRLTQDPFHWTGIGSLGLVLLFIPSIRLSESISASKYPGYKAYQESTYKFLPLGTYEE